ncbi:cell envelope integrity protein TolA [Hydrogenophaga pseudoflava]|uniref:cell envelope integrity protein TolA n=1 Tax=Hydrogenophaga pseudoflava TaxID=47421 RepID=UPI0027E57BF1|nr:cell envelope integrity protein TolA [Hydrogenophaga pseudoflava]MDQ7747357.1 cell envelope integrity protein TolA [Hydrogenophaga pseudoflava]
MQIITDAIDFKPPRSGRWGTPLALALAAHVLLMAALTWGVHWKQDEPQVAFEAEIWSALPREAAPRAVEPPPPPPPEPEPRPEPKPEPKPEPRPEPPPPQPAVKQPDIATEKAKQKKLEDEKRRELEEARKEKAAKEKAEREKKEKELAEKKKAEDQKKLAEKKKQDQERREAERREEQLADKMRRDQLARMMGQVGASGGPEARGSAQQSSGPSSGYGARVRAKVSPNIRYTEDFPRSLRTEIEVRALPDGTITARRVVDSSGNSAWDEAALKAIDRTGSLPRDVDGRVPSPIIIVVRPTD